MAKLYHIIGFMIKLFNNKQMVFMFRSGGFFVIKFLIEFMDEKEGVGKMVGIDT